ncbi:RHS repeat-associated core domain-containing protein [Pseudomonas sp. G166]|uniref:RHS repeat-associated core domain-containing protein n=1 Tax=Pseudomonas sp. G166 TaxID=3094846 RepID=UPI0030D1D1E5
MSATRLCTYRYDPLDRLTSHAMTTQAPVQRFYCKSRLATEIEGAINRSIVQHDEQLLALTETQGNISQATLVASDQQRSVLQALAADESQSFAYSPYGHHPTGDGLLGLLGFNGERPDPVTGHYLLGNGYRAFNPVLMRFNSPDSLSPFGEGGLNSYAYCMGDPINHGDPQGHVPVKFISTLAPKYLKINALRKIQTKIIKTKNPTVEQIQTIKEKIFQEQQDLLSEIKLLKRAIPSNDDLKKPFTFPESKQAATEAYFAHQKAGIPFDKHGIPNPDRALTALNESGTQNLRTDFFDDSIAFFHLQAHSKILSGRNNEAFTRAMLESAGRAMEKRLQYIRRYALRDY